MLKLKEQHLAKKVKPAEVGMGVCVCVCVCHEKPKKVSFPELETKIY